MQHCKSNTFQYKIKKELSLKGQIILILRKSNVSILSGLCFSVLQIFAYPKSWRFPLFSLRFYNFSILLGFMIHFELIFCVQPEVKVEDHLLYEYPAVSAPFVHWINLASLLKINWPHLPGSISGLYSVSLISVSTFCQYHHLDDYSLTILQPGGICPLTVFSFQIVLAILSPFHFI